MYVEVDKRVKLTSYGTGGVRVRFPGGTLRLVGIELSAWASRDDKGRIVYSAEYQDGAVKVAVNGGELAVPATFREGYAAGDTVRRLLDPRSKKIAISSVG